MHYVVLIYNLSLKLALCYYSVFILLVNNLFATQTWSVIGRLPYRVKTTLTGFWNGYLYFTSGQRDRGPDNPQPRQVVGDMFRTKLNL